MHELKLFAGLSNPILVKEVCDYLKLEQGNALVSTFSDGEIRIQINENVRGKDVFLFQSCCDPVNKHWLELWLMIDALRRSSAYRITAVIPYYGYGRQDRKDQPRVPISARLMADLTTRAGADRVLTMDLHAGQIQGFFEIPVDHLYAAPVLLEYVRRKSARDLVVVSPDAGGVERARAFAKRLQANLAIIDKRREGPNEAQVMHIIGDVNGRDALLLDDIIDTGGTLAEAARACKKHGARKVWAACTHPVLSGPALDRLNSSDLEEVVVTNTIPLNGKDRVCPKLTVLSVALLLGEAIRRIHEEESVSSLFV